MKKILILYRELAGYFVECLNHLCEKHNVEAVLVAYPVHSDAPFQFQLSPKIKVLQRNDLDENQLVELCSDPSYSLIFTGGWFDKSYLAALRHRKSPALLGFDNQWNGSAKHILSAVYGRFRIKPLFEYAFVPGNKQVAFARKLGFSLNEIITGAYACDVATFNKISNDRVAVERSGPMKLIYVGRYAEEKFIIQLWRVFSNLKKKFGYDWELHCAGTGPLWEKRDQSEGILHHGFKQPSELYEFMKSGDAFILPSTFEPWGVVVHEFAAAAYPMILSSNVGSGEVFLKTGSNGYMFESGNENDLEEKMNLLFNKNREELNSMGMISKQLASSITPDTWADSLYKKM